jgi:hypothetical protein
MMSSRIVTGAFLVGVLAVSPALAQERHARQRSEQSGDRGGGGDRGGSRGGDRGDRGGSRTVDRGGDRRVESGRVYQRAPERAPSRSYDSRRSQAPRQYTAPRSDVRRYDAPRRNDTVRRYDAPRAYDSRRANAPRRYEAPRAYDNNRRAYTRPGYAPRRDPYYRSGSAYRGYNSRSYSYSRRYVYGGYRGVYGYGNGYRRNRIVTVLPWRPYHYRPRFSIGVYYGAGGVYDYGYTPSYFYDPLPGRTYGGVRITEAPRDAQVFVDGYYVGIVDDFDGVFQHVNLEAGQHRIEVRAADYEPLSFDVYVQPGRTITLRADDYDDGYVENGDGY